MARVTAKRKKEIREFVERWEGWFYTQEMDWGKNLPFKVALRMLRELLGE